MKRVILISGIPNTGKSWVAEKLSNITGMSVLSADNVYQSISNQLGVESISDRSTIPYHVKHEWWRLWLNNHTELKPKGTPDDFIIEGTELMFSEDRQIVLSILNSFKPTMFHIVPDFKTWSYIISRKNIISGYATQKEYYSYMVKFEEPEFPYYLVTNPSIIPKRYVQYQHEGLTDEKLKLFKLGSLDNEKIIDIGCAEGMVGEYCLKNGASHVTGVDHNFEFLEKAKTRGVNVVLDSLETIDLTRLGKFDRVFCLAVLHHVYNKPRLIDLVSQVTKKFAYFEVPITQEKGLVLRRYDDIEGNKKVQQSFCPSQELMEEWLTKYFKSFSIVGESLSPGDKSKRIIYRGENICLGKE